MINYQLLRFYFSLIGSNFPLWEIFESLTYWLALPHKFYYGCREGESH